MRIRAKFEICFHANTAPPRDAFFMRPVDAIGAKGYDDVRALARGRYGAVYEARRRACGTLCAVKCIPIDDDDDEDADASDEARRGSMKTARRAREEATMLARLGDEHANVATLVEFWVNRDVGAAFLAMRHGGCDVARVIRANWRVLPLEVCFDIAIQLGMGLRHVHSNRIVHGDLKPENVFVDEDVVVVIGDFGSARATRRARGARMSEHRCIIRPRWSRDSRTGRRGTCGRSDAS